ncbi:unnamed protein product, partial [Ectocarpus sp. 6 AP-2014]
MKSEPYIVPIARSVCRQHAALVLGVVCVHICTVRGPPAASFFVEFVSGEDSKADTLLRCFAPPAAARNSSMDIPSRHTLACKVISDACGVTKLFRSTHRLCFP